MDRTELKNEIDAERAAVRAHEKRIAELQAELDKPAGPLVLVIGPYGETGTSLWLADRERVAEIFPANYKQRYEFHALARMFCAAPFEDALIRELHSGKPIPSIASKVRYCVAISDGRTPTAEERVAWGL